MEIEAPADNKLLIKYKFDEKLSYKIKLGNSVLARKMRNIIEDYRQMIIFKKVA